MRVAVTLLQCWHDTPGGTATSALSQAAAVAATGDLDLIGVAPWGRSVPSAPWTPPIPFRRLPLPYQLVYDGWHRLHLPPVQLATGSVDVVHATTVTVPPTWRGTPVVVTVHDVFPITHPERLSPRGARLLSAGIELAKSAALVLCPSDATAESCREIGFDEDRLIVVPWGVTPPQVTDAEVAAVQVRHGLDRPYVLWVGTIEPRKNLEMLVAAFVAMHRDDVDLVVVGPDGWQTDGDALVAPHERVRRLGFVSDHDLAALNAGAEVLCLPSYEEGFGMTALEAMVHGTPVIGSNVSAIPEIIGDTGVLVAPDDCDGWSGAIGALLDDDRRRGELGSLAAARAAGFTWGRCAELTVAAYRHAALR